LRDPSFLAAFLMVLVAVCLTLAGYLLWFDLFIPVGPFTLTHWLGLTGATFIALYTPTYYVVKRRSPRRTRALLNVHVFGNLSSFTLVSVHFAQNTGAGYGPGLGAALYATVMIHVATGFSQRFGLAKGLGRYRRLAHVASAVAFYLILTAHILRGSG